MNSENYLQTLFDAARNADPVLSADEISTGLLHYRSIPGHQTYTLTTKILITMSASILLLGGFYILVSNFNSSQQLNQKHNPSPGKKEVQAQQSAPVRLTPAIVFSKALTHSEREDQPIRKSVTTNK